MAEKNIAKPKEAKTEDKPKQPTVVSVIKEFGPKGAKNRGALAEVVFKELQKRGIKNNSKGKEIKQEKVLSLISAMCRDIKAPRNGWWSTWEVVEKDDSFLMRAKPSN